MDVGLRMGGGGGDGRGWVVPGVDKDKMGWVGRGKDIMGCPWG